MLAFSWLPWPLDEIKSRRDGPRTGNRHFILKKVKFYSRSRKKVTVLNLFYKGAVNAYFLTGSFFKKTVVFEAAIFVGQSENGAEVRCEVSRRVEKAVSRYSGPSALRFLRCSARTRFLCDFETTTTLELTNKTPPSSGSRTTEVLPDNKQYSYS